MRAVAEDERKTPELKVPANPPRVLGIGKAGRAMWKRILTAVQLELPDELEHLICACRCADELERMQTKLLEDSVMIKGSKQQLVAHPLFAELRLHRATLAKHLTGLRMAGSEEGFDAAARSANARAMANQRWNRQIPGQAGLSL